MDYIATLTELFQVPCTYYSERIKNVDAEIVFPVSNIPQFVDVVDALEVFPSRDRVQLTIVNENDDFFLFVSNEVQQEEDYNSFIKSCEFSEFLSVKISITKTIDCEKFSVYNYSNFTEEACNLSCEKLMQAFALLFDGNNRLFFEVFDQEVLFKTKTMIFSSMPQPVLPVEFNRKRRLSRCLDTTYFLEQRSYPLLPEDFQIEVDFEGNAFTEVFLKLSNLLSLIYLSTSASLDQGILKVNISGQRNIEFQIATKSYIPNKELFAIYSWIYTDGNSVDKALLARNILSLHCRYTNLLEIDGKTFASIQSNYNLYLKENVSQYIELTNRLSEFIVEVISKTGDYAFSLLEKLKSNLIALCGFLFTVVLTSIVSNSDFNHIFTKDITIIFESVLLGSLGYMLICAYETKLNLNEVRNSYMLLKKNYSKVLTEEDINIAFADDELINNAMKKVKNTSYILVFLWVILIIIGFVVTEILSVNPIITPLIKNVIDAMKLVLIK